MARPKTKVELLRQGEGNYKKLVDFVDALPEGKRLSEFPKGTMNRNIRDVFAHLYHWHGMMLNWYKVGMSGCKPEMPAPGYTWKTTPELNRLIWEKYRNTPYIEVRGTLEESHKSIMKIVSNHTNEELFEKKRYKWTGSTSLGAYLISATSSHYDWALKLIKKAIR